MRIRPDDTTSATPSPPMSPASVLDEMASLSHELASRTAQVESRRREQVEARESQQQENEEAPCTNPRPCLFWKHTDKNGYLSNWARSTFELDGRVFTRAEQLLWS